MPPPVGVVPSDVSFIVQVTEAHGVGDSGWSETYFMEILSGASPLAGAIARHQTIVNARRLAIPAVHVIETLRASFVDIRGDSILLFPPEAGLGPGEGPAGDINPALGYFMNTWEATGLVNTTRIYRGWNKTDTVWTPGSPRTVEPPGGPRASLVNIGGELIATRTIAGHTTRYMMRSYQRPDSVGGPARTAVGTVTTDGNGRLEFTWPLPIPAGWLAGKYIHVEAPRVKCVRGVSGRHLITAINTVGTNFVVVTATSYECPVAALTAVAPKGFLEIVAYFPIARYSIGGAGKKDTGRPFYLTRGRRSARR